MDNVLHVLKRDILRLLKVPPAMVVIIALLVLPSLYTWYNVLGFWNPYENTGKLSVCVVNQDEGSESKLTGHIDVGQMIVDELHENHQLDWRFVSYDEAMDQVRSGESYAAFVIPEDFSDKLLTITTGDFQQPDIDYYVNEKQGPVGPKITDTGANTLDDQINTAFVETVSQKVTEALDETITQSEDKVTQARSRASQSVQEAKASLQEASDSIAELSTRAEEAKQRAEAAKSSLGTARNAIDEASSAMDSVASLASKLQSDYMSFAATSVPEITAAMQDAADAYASAVRALAALPAVDDKLLEELRASADRAQEAAQRYSQILADDVSPAISKSLGQLASAASQAAGAIAGQKVVISQAGVVMDDMVATMESASSSLSQTHCLLDELIGEMDRIETDTMMIAGSTLITNLIGEDSLNARTVAEFISTPTKIVTEQLYPVDTYGAAMAPLFMNLTFWIGAFMLMVVMRQEVDAEGIKNLTLTQRYVSRFLLYAIMAALQAAICCAGLPIIGVHIVNLPALFFAASIASLSYLSIIYALSVTFQHIGKGICVILVFAQIPAATGLYPIEMTSPFFQAIYPALPFTYGISAMRESICGFYGFHYLHDILILITFFAAFMAVGILLRPLLSNVNRMFARQIKVSGIYNGESIEVPARRFRVTQMLRALTDREEYRKAIVRRYDAFQRIYPDLIRGAVISSIAVPVLIVLVFSLGLTGKAMLLVIWICWIVLVFLFLIIVESLRQSFDRQLHLDTMDDAELRSLWEDRNKTEKASVVHKEHNKKTTAEESGETSEDGAGVEGEGETSAEGAEDEAGEAVGEEGDQHA